MTPLKFRAWSVTQKKMLYDNKLRIVSDQVVDFRKVLLNNFIEAFSHQGDILMQSTGLQDRTGKEIFCGDIVSWPDTESEYVNVGIGEVKVAETGLNTFGPIVFKDGCFGVESPGGECCKQGFYSLKEFLYDYCAPEDIEIIGNIYQNPELL